MEETRWEKAQGGKWGGRIRYEEIQKAQRTRRMNGNLQLLGGSRNL